MRTKLNKDDVSIRVESDNYREYEYLYQFDNIIKQYQVDESGICFFDKDEKVISMFKTDSISETENTMKKIVAVCELSDEEITKFNKVRHIIKGSLEICFRKKISVFLLSLAFMYMNIVGIKEGYFILNIMYTWGFFKITEVSKAIKFIKETIELYKLREEALGDKEFMDFFNNTVTDDVDDMKLYLMLSKNEDKTLQI